ncbi:hypothetical protein A2797_01080 [candidate division WWE3 bacterium RIFCSPHIGHO2_01_FULL_48_15]|uniref:Uncharacterized protein n=1 Tax=candidate division WWE3 bacterium RIFCSPHIGHO2_01_FULL_48_15 TaxID=1802619 RepID=A0A1F4VEF2_UNCKA|nr:MAG: hypothetical protein A2797_01080 [candidate division WWE3 bacterium RIFCSPHIGHO2_01_FULL_48_15]
MGKITDIFASKRLRFFAVSAFLAGLLVLLSSYTTDNILAQFVALFLPPIFAIFLTYLTLERPGGIEIVTLLLLPAILVAGASLNQYFFPNLHLVFKLGSWLSFFSIFYLLLLSLNIFRVERVKKESIPLEKVAKPAIFLFSFLAMFLLLTVLYKLALGVVFSTLVVFLISFVLSLNFFWFLTLSNLFERRFFLGAAVVAGGLAQVSLAFSFFPWESFLRALSEGVFFYSMLGIARAYYERHLRYRIVIEYIIVALAVFLFTRVFS